ncbi:HAAS signaling domain-containing protein [Streptomyces sp. BBFR102]|uniref:HAAS signaling domain-containing protein n=1 Tax=Streptomyces sp. BBFR102 TaxID=3448171 RepID=UPI003F52FE8D
MKSGSAQAAYQERDAYLAEVERAAAELADDRRRALVADVAVRIDRGLDGRPEAMSEVLAELGDPRAVAAGSSSPGRPPVPAGRPARVHPAVPVGLIAASYALALVLQLTGVPTGVLAVALLVRLTGVVLLCTSRFWRPWQKLTGVLVTLVLPAAANLLWNQVLSGEDLMALRVLADLLQLVCVVGGAAWLWRTRRRA